MLLLGWAVGKGSTPLDDAFLRLNDRHPEVGWLLFFVDLRTQLVLWVCTLAVVLWRRRWRLALVTVLSPVVAISVVRLLKPLFGREKDGTLCYPSGHVTALVVVLSLAVLAAGCAAWGVMVAVAVCLLGVFSIACTFHYFTDTIGALLLGTAVMCVAVLSAGLAPSRPASSSDDPALQR